jgi:hypothetical protein
MIELDSQLIGSAHQLITDGNAHRAKTLIFVYEQAVRLHNQHHPEHLVYQARHEHALRAFVNRPRLIQELQLNAVELRNWSAELNLRSARINQVIEEHIRA